MVCLIRNMIVHKIYIISNVDGVDVRVINLTSVTLKKNTTKQTDIKSIDSSASTYINLDIITNSPV